MNKEYTFTLKYKLPNHEVASDELAERLYANNCDDALIGIGMPKRIALEFIREASSAEEAVNSAHQDVMITLPEAEFIEASPDYVGMTDIANMVNVSRQQIRKLYNQNVHSFPSPVHEGKSTLWHLAAVLEWLAINAPAIAYPYLRSFITNALVSAGYPAVYLPTVNLVEIAKQQ